ncbi:MAG: hypothetical protein PF450_06625 [Bacteroidales bacterium]|nr:hypothetical protein [Bacteroidales bacterium]
MEKRLSTLMPTTVARRVSIPGLSKEVIVNYNIQLKKWFFYLYNSKEHKHSFFVGNWRFGGEALSYNGSISISWTGSQSNAGIFAKDGADVFLLHSGVMGGRKLTDFYEKYEGEIISDIEGADKDYAVVGKMDDPDIAEKTVCFFDFLGSSKK